MLFPVALVSTAAQSRGEREWKKMERWGMPYWGQRKFNHLGLFGVQWHSKVLRRNMTAQPGLRSPFESTFKHQLTSAVGRAGPIVMRPVNKPIKHNGKKGGNHLQMTKRCWQIATPYLVGPLLSEPITDNFFFFQFRFGSGSCTFREYRFRFGFRSG